MDKARHGSTVVAGIAIVAIAASLAIGGIAASGATSSAVAGGGLTTAMHHHSEHGLSPTGLAFHDAMRKLWEDHITWTRLFIVSFAADLPDLAPTTDRLLQNQVDIGDAIKPFYGKAAGHRLTHLLTEHITTAATLLQAAKDGDTAAFDEAKDAWYANARSIARFLHAANPEQWPLRDLRSMMREHLDLTLAEAAHRLAGEYEADIADYDAVHAEILEMADMLSDGIIAQFPDRFSYAR
jgi:hypothetical protein